MSSSSTNEALQDAYEKFLKSLPAKEQARYSPCISANDLLDGLGKLEILSMKRQRSRSRFLLGHIKEFSDRLQPYLDAIGAMVQGNPYACIAWGALRLILQLASNFSSFFEKLVQLIQQLSETFPQYAEIASLPSICKSGRMKHHLEGVYSVLFQFFQGVAQIFAKPDGTARRNAAVACGLFWTPFDVRFKSILDQMKYYKDIIRDEITIAQALASSNSEEAAEKERLVAEKERHHAEKARSEIDALSSQAQKLLEANEKTLKDETFRSTHRWLRPGDYAEIFQKSCDLREDGTCHWIWDSPKLKEWRDGDWSLRTPITQKKNVVSANVLWVYGNPGSGKTILASSVVEELESHVLTSDTHPTVCYHFFSSERPNSSDVTTSSSAYRAILAQILQQHKNDTVLMEKFAFTAGNGTAQLHASTSELIDLLSLCSQHIEHIYLILDGIDECDDAAALIKTLGVLTAASPLKIILFSRVSVPCLSKTVVPLQRLPLDASALGVDIGYYLSRCIASLIEDDLLRPAHIPNLVEHLVRGADGMFLWAKLMVNYLNSPVLTPARRLETIQHVIFPEGLEKMYDRILILIGKYGKTERDLARNIFAWLTYSKRPLTIHQLYEATHKDESDTEAGTSYQDASFREAINMVCGSLVECRAPKHASRGKDSPREFINGKIYDDGFDISFIHLSIKEHFIQSSTSTSGDEAIIPHEPIVHFDLARRCLQSLMSMRQGEFYRTSTFTQYSVANWIGHFADCAKSEQPLENLLSNVSEATLRQFCSILSDLLRSPKVITTWLTAYFSYTDSFSPQHLSVDGLNKWSSWSESLDPSSGVARELKTMSQPIAELSADIQKLTDTWGEKLRQNPGILWDEGTAFMSSRFLYTSYETKITSLAPKATEDSKASSRPLCTVSTTSADSTISAVLSVWPSKQYEERWHELGSNEAISRVQDVCSDWTARYELWNTQTKQSVAKLRCPLDEGEVWLHMRQSLYETDLGSWSTSFPMVISNDIDCFVVLRTVFVFYAAANTSSQATYQQTVLPTDSLKDHAYRWTDNLTAFDPMNEKIRDLPLKWIHRDRYKYSVDLSPNGRYLSFMHSDFMSQLAVFEILRADTLRVKPLNNYDFGPFNRSVKTAFHLWADYIVIAEQTGIKLWEFKKEENAIIYLHNHPYHATLPSISISSCGKFLVVLGEGTPNVIPLPDFPLGDTTSSEQSQPIMPDCQDIIALGSTETSKFGLHLGKALDKASVVNYRDGKVSSVVTIEGGDEPTIRLTSGTGQLDETLKLMSLPQSVEMTHTTPTIMLPEGKGECIRIAINMNPRHEYSMTGIPDRHLPALIERDARALKHISVHATARDLTIMPSAEPQCQVLSTTPAANAMFSSGSMRRQDSDMFLNQGLTDRSLKRKPSLDNEFSSGEPPKKR